MKNANAILAGRNLPCSFRDLAVPSNWRVAVLAPHPDDFDAVGITLKLLRENGNPIALAVINTGSGVADSYRPGATRRDKARLRREEQENSLRFFGLAADRTTFLDLEMDGEDQPVDSQTNEQRVGDWLLPEEPDVVFLPHGNDTNTGHQNVYALFRTVVSRAERSLVALLNRDPKTIALRTDLYTPFGEDEAAWKGELLRFHDSQHRRNLQTRGHGFDDRILDENRRIASELSLDSEFAEAFEIETY